MSVQSERLASLCQELNLPSIAEQYGPIAQEAARKELSFADFLERVLKLETQARQLRSRSMLMRTAGFPALKTIEEYDFHFASNRPELAVLTA